jgi:hypothetical protein
MKKIMVALIQSVQDKLGHLPINHALLTIWTEEPITFLSKG